MILAGDVGGTSTRLAFFERQGERLTPVTDRTYPSRYYKSLEDIIRDFLTTEQAHAGLAGSPECACFGIAGPVKRRRAELPNLGWVVKADVIEAELARSPVGLINDLEANAYGVAELQPEDFLTLNAGETNSTGNAAIISAGTGLGEAGFYWDGRQHRPFASEGGHTEFAPCSEIEVELLRFLWAKLERVSYERVLSGPGLYNIYQFFRDTGRGKENPSIAAEMQQRDPSAVISRAALDGQCALCEQALDLFVSIYGAEAGNLALKNMATAGLYIGGGIAPKIIQKLKNPAFMTSFTAKGRMKPLLEAIPVRVILNDKAALLGAARYAAFRLNKGLGATI
jgi:glucokinase